MIHAVCFGEVLWDILPTGAKPGGAPMNVAYHLNHLGINAKIISKVGDDEKGKKLLEFLTENQVATELVQTSTDYATGTVIATPGPANEMQYDIVKPVAYDFIDVQEAATNAVKNAGCFVFGSLAARAKHSRDTLLELISLAKTKVLDINLRAPHYQQEVLESFMNHADILKLNEHELEIVSDWYADISKFEDKVRLISDRYQIRQILVTKGGDGAVYFNGESFFNHPGFKVQVADTVGSGDSFLAAFLSKYFANAQPQDCIEFACKLGAFVASQTGGCPHYEIKEEEIKILKPQD